MSAAGSYEHHSRGAEETRMPSPGRPVLNKNLFMHNVCSCLDSCSAYIQALNSLCAAGTMLAHSLVQVFHELPPYRDIAEQFLGSWEELSRTTAGASAAVKTETLMALQEVLNSLEDENMSRDSNKTVTDVIRSVGCCLTTYIELQAQFSLCCWKSLSRLSKIMSTDSMFFCPPCSFGLSHSDNASGSLARGQELVSSVRKCFGQLLQKFNSSGSPGLESSPVHQMYGSESSLQMRHGQLEQPHLSSFWPLLSNSYPSSSTTCNSQPRQSSISNDMTSTPVPVSNELEEVLNLLSCQPSDISSPIVPASESNPYSNGPVPILSNPSQSGSNQLWGHKDLSASSDSAVNVCAGSVYTNFEGKRTWPRMSDHTSHFNFSQWPCYGSGQDATSVQSSQNCNVAWCSSSSGSGNRWSSGQGENGSSSEEDSLQNGNCQDGEVFSIGLGISGLMSNLGSAGRQRRHSSNDGCQEGYHLELESEIKATISSWEPRAITKTSTWPLKQSSPRSLEPGCLPDPSPSPHLASPVPSGSLSTPWSPPHRPSQDTGTQDTIKESKYTLFGQMP